MRRATSALLAASILGAIGVLVFSSGHSTAGFTGGGGNLPVDIVSAPRLDVSATTAPGTYLAVAGDSAGARLSVDIPGTVTLSSSTLAALNGRFCVPGGQQKEGIGGTVVGVPPISGDGGTGAQQGRTSISVTYPSQSSSGFISCFSSGLDGGTSPVCTLPTAGAVTDGFQIPEGGAAVIELSDAYVLRCLHCTSAGAPSGSTVVISYIESDCYNP